MTKSKDFSMKYGLRGNPDEIGGQEQNSILVSHKKSWPVSE